MSGFISEPERSHERHLATHTGNYGKAEDPLGQRHDSMAGGASKDPSVTTYEQGEEDTKMDISAGQKMLSAVSGSLLTSLLVTPLDVVRVRLQSQPSQPKAYTLPSTGSIARFTNLPPNLGVTACCREVFWVNNASPFCMAGPGSATAASGSSTFNGINTSLPSHAMEPAADCAVDASRQKTFNSTLDGLRKIARNEGATSLWRGLSPTLIMSVPANVIYFTGYDYLRYNPRSPIHRFIADDYAPLIAGSVARVSAATVISPIEMFRTRMQATTGGEAGVFMETFRGLRTMVHGEGYRSLWRGLTLTLWRDVPFSGIYWWGYETVRNGMTDAREVAHLRSGRPRSKSRDQNHTSTFIDSFIAGATSGAIASLVTTPFDVGKTRQQVLEREQSKPGGSGVKAALRPEELSMPRFLYSIFKDEGAAGLFRGWAARCLKVAPACAIMISSYEVGKLMAGRMNERKRDLAAAGKTKDD